jgi:hypothetical protein
MDFESWQSYGRFVAAVRRQRFVRTSESETFLEAVRLTAASRTEVIRAGTHLWRAQIGHELEPDEAGGWETPLRDARMRPRPERAMEGRANPCGAPVLYLAECRETALAEARPWIGAMMTIAKITLNRPAQVVDFSRAARYATVHYSEEPPPGQREAAVWADLNRAFSRPVDRSDDLGEYVPTQIIAELFRANGFDGIAYASLLGAGRNLALFDIGAGKIVERFLYETRGAVFSFEPACSRYRHVRGDERDSLAQNEAREEPQP